MSQDAHHWSNAALELMAHRFKLLAEPSRLRLLYALLEGEKGVNELAANTGMRQANVSQQLGLLTEGGLLLRRREGCSIRYRIADPTWMRINELACRGLRQREQLQLDHLHDDAAFEP